MRILLTNNTLALRAGSELYVRDVALALLARGHTPIAYSTVLGEMADDLRRATIPVIDDLRQLAEPPDVIHGQAHLETMTALLHFPGVRALYMCHGWLPWQAAAPRFPRIHRYVAVDHLCRERLVSEAGVPIGDVELLPNFVDLRRFVQRDPLPPRPTRALVFGAEAGEDTYVPMVRAACAAAAIPRVDAVGYREGNVTAAPERLLGEYDLVFAKGRSALEALAVGCAVVLCGGRGVGPMVTRANVDQLREVNLGIRALVEPMATVSLAHAIAGYDPRDAAATSAHVRSVADSETIVDRLVALYATIRESAPRPGENDPLAERLATILYLQETANLMKRTVDGALERAHHAERESRRAAAAPASPATVTEHTDNGRLSRWLGGPSRLLVRLVKGRVYP